MDNSISILSTFMGKYIRMKEVNMIKSMYTVVTLTVKTEQALNEVKPILRLLNGLNS